MHRLAGMIAVLSVLLCSGAQAQMSNAENEYYAQNFTYAMSTLKAGETYHWKSTDITGTITAGEFFTSKSQALCRPYADTLSVGSQQYAASGYACQRQGREGWCRLREGNMLSCALESPDNMLDALMEDAAAVANRAGAAVSGVSAPGVGPVNGPNMDIQRSLGNIGQGVGVSKPHVDAPEEEPVSWFMEWWPGAADSQKEARQREGKISKWFDSWWPF